VPCGQKSSKRTNQTNWKKGKIDLHDLINLKDFSQSDYKQEKKKNIKI